MYDDKVASQVPQIEIEQKQLDETIGRLQSEWGTLQTRLQSVMASVTPSMSGVGLNPVPAPQENLSPMAEQVRRVRREIEAVCVMIESVRSRLQV